MRSRPGRSAEDSAGASGRSALVHWANEPPQRRLRPWPFEGLRGLRGRRDRAFLYYPETSAGLPISMERYPYIAITLENYHRLIIVLPIALITRLAFAIGL